MQYTFGNYHPINNFMFFMGAIGMTMFINNPYFVMSSMLCAVCYYLVLNRNKSKKFLVFAFTTPFVISIINACMNPLGNTVLFTWLNNRAFTKESLIYGFIIGLNFMSVILWFSCYNSIMTNDKFMYLFSKFAPSITLVLSMTLRLVPSFEKKIKTIIETRQSIGKSIHSDKYMDKINYSMEILSVLTSRALEDSVITADSMRSRGYVASGRTNYIVYNKTTRDKINKIVFVILFILILPCMLTGGMSCEFIPRIILPQTNIVTYTALISFTIFLLIPTIIELAEEITWFILKSKI